MQRSSSAIDQRLKNLLHLSARMKLQVTAVFDLVDRILISKPAAPLLLQIQGKQQTSAVNPSLAELAQAPYGPFFEQGVCHPRQVCWVRGMRKAIALFGKV